MEPGDLTYIKIPYPAVGDLHFKITAPMTTLDISPGLSAVWATGKYSDPKSVIPYFQKLTGGSAEIILMGAFAYRTSPRLLPHLKLAFGRLKPFALALELGDLGDHLNFGGLPLTALDIRYGAGSQVLEFSSPNPQEMAHLTLAADAGPIQVDNLSHANAGEIRLNGDATVYRLNFGGELARSASLRIGVRVARVEIALPSGAAVKVEGAPPTGGPAAGDFTHVDHHYWNAPARKQKEPLLTIHNTAANAPLHISFV